MKTLNALTISDVFDGFRLGKRIRGKT